MYEGSVLIVDDEPAMRDLVETDLRLRGFQAESSGSAVEAFERLQRQPASEERSSQSRTQPLAFDVVLTDVKMPGVTGIELCRQLREVRPDVPVIVMTAFGSMETAVSALRAGAFDFVTKPIQLDVLAMTLQRAIENRSLREQLRLLTDAARPAQRFGKMLGESPPMLKLYDQLERVAPSDAAVLITGESGTGKELAARSIHEGSDRAEKPYVAVNCAALSDTLLESELFGHSKGAFTDARTDRKGLILESDGGTLFLDEMGDMPLALQVKLLRALEERKLRPVGSDKEVEFDVRVLSATHRDLESAVAEGRFREDLYYRINVIQISLPPLRARGTDILLIAKHFAEQFSNRSNKPIVGIAEPAAEKLLGYSWPGNIRELRNVMERAVALTRYDKISVEDLPEKIREHRGRVLMIGGDDPNELVTMEELERRYIRHVLEATGDNRTLAAKILGFDRKTLYRKLKQQEPQPDAST